MVLDKLGNQVDIGDYIAVAYARSRAARIRIGIVSKIHPQTQNVSYTSVDGKYSNICKNGEFIKLEKPRK